jgi:hypothetical protein
METNLDDKESKLPKRHFKELLYVPIFLIFFFLFEFKLKQSIVAAAALQEEVEVLFVFTILGLFHVVASNVLAFLYNLRTLMLPFSKRPRIEITARNIKALGIILVFISVIGWFVIFSKK